MIGFNGSVSSEPKYKAPPTRPTMLVGTVMICVKILASNLYFSETSIGQTRAIN